jgi:fucose permease
MVGSYVERLSEDVVFDGGEKLAIKEPSDIEVEGTPESTELSTTVHGNEGKEIETDQPVKSEEHSQPPLESWKNPRRNMLRIGAAYFGFIVFGMGDSSIGVLVPNLELYYNLSYLQVSTAFLAPFVGYLVAALISDKVHHLVGRWGASIIAPTCQLTCYIIAICAPPFPLFVIGYAICGFGNGTIEASWNSWMGSLDAANEVMGFLHGFYGLGGILCPSIFTAIINSGRRWNICYSVMIGMTSTALMISTAAFWGDTAAVYKKTLKQHADSTGEVNSSLRQVVRNKVVWLMAFSLFLYVGAEVSFGGWITTFMIVVRHGNRHKMGFVTTGFWTGLTVGRMSLGFVAGRFRREEIQAAIYMALAIGCILVFWWVPILYVSAVFAALFGFVIGPLFPTVVVVAVKKLPKRLHVSGVGFASAVGGAGAAVLPFINGVIADEYGPQVLCPLVFSLFTAMLILWLIILKFF